MNSSFAPRCENHAHVKQKANVGKEGWNWVAVVKWFLYRDSQQKKLGYDWFSMIFIFIFRFIFIFISLLTLCNSTLFIQMYIFSIKEDVHHQVVLKTMCVCVCEVIAVILAIQTSRASSRILHKKQFPRSIIQTDWFSPRALWDLSAFPWSVWVYCPTSARHGCSSFRKPVEKEV